MHPLDRLRVAGFKSIRDQTVELRQLNVLIGSNGSGKSNFIGIFRLLHEIVESNLQSYVAKAGGANQLLHFGRKATEEILLHLHFGRNQYLCRLGPTAGDSLVFTEERIFFRGLGYDSPFDASLGSGQEETRLWDEAKRRQDVTIADHVIQAVRGWTVYHFHDTSAAARVKQTVDLSDNVRLRPDAGNLAAFLFRLQETAPAAVRSIVDTIRMVAPFFDRFELRPDRLNPGKIRLEWRERGSDDYFNADTLSDGTLRFICLATLLLQSELPSTVLIDEPELGLHPYAINVLAGLLQSAAERTQIVVSTQSVTLVNQLRPEDVIVVDRRGGESLFRRLFGEEIASWLDDYSLGELWEKNVLGGRPGG